MINFHVFLSVALGFFLSCTVAFPSDFFQANNLISAHFIPLTDEDTLANDFLTQKRAERILGERASIDENATKSNKGVEQYRGSYKALSQEKGKLGVVYFLLQKFPDEEGATKQYEEFMRANQPFGIEKVEGLGDEAYFHTGKENFYLIMVRKGHILFNLKVNKITSRTSSEALKTVEEEIVHQLD